MFGTKCDNLNQFSIMIFDLNVNADWMNVFFRQIIQHICNSWTFQTCLDINFHTFFCGTVLSTVGLTFLSLLADTFGLGGFGPGAEIVALALHFIPEVVHSYSCTALLLCPLTSLITFSGMFPSNMCVIPVALRLWFVNLPWVQWYLPTFSQFLSVC